ncbi:EAL domain-containing protein [Paenibacillus athensensis]|uniref:Diguanylate cyclase n=1 Tax=Paenibacillus athensensis TaxID=1967502 RepID=A0A4Y8QAM2_9BACL|nr:EAL domain-containing protein [Paenibacillus athensensis]MCD1257602.1 EAL domain-containing protein [Paenibacillus athensensis]
MANEFRIGVMAPHLDGEYFGKIIEIVHSAVRKQGGQLLALHTMIEHRPDFTIRDPVSQDVTDGWLVVLDTVSDSVLRQLKRSGKPIVGLAHYRSEVPWCHVRMDNRQGMKEAVLHLIAHGHRNIAFVGQLREAELAERFDGYRDALAEHGIPLRDELIINVPDNLFTGGAEAAQRINELGTAITAVAAGTDMNALGLIDTLRQTGRQLPGELAVTGFDNIALAATHQPPLTTIEYPVVELAQRAIDELLALIAGRRPAERIQRLPGRLVHRSSCGCALTPARTADSFEAYETLIAEQREALNQMFTNNYHLIKGLVQASTGEHMHISKLYWNECHRGIMALWDTDVHGQRQLVVKQVFSTRGDPLPELGARYPAEAFPPPEFLPVNTGEGRDDYAVVHPLVSDQLEWGFLALVGPFHPLNLITFADISRHSYTILATHLERESLFRHIRFIAEHDSLTGLPNRAHFHQRLEEAMNEADRARIKLAVLLIDLDRFKDINDALGHQFGDRMLQHIAQKLRACVRDSDTVARLGGDEFIVLLPQLRDAGEIWPIAGRIMDSLNEPFVLGGQELRAVGSIGASLYPDHAVDAEALIKYADIAMYTAKENGGGLLQMYTDELSSKAVKRFTLEAGLRKALERGELTLHYQPQIALHSGRLFGAEALLRWHSPERGLVPPMEFIPLAEEMGLIVPIGTWVLQEACRQVKAWQEEGRAPLVMSVNISAQQFRHPDFVEQVRRTLKETGVGPEWMCLEITETMAIGDMEGSEHKLQQLVKLGLQIALDDFGTGYSSLALVKRLPIHAIKIDKSFIRDMTEDSDDAAIVKAIIAMTHSLGLTVVAEGVEDLDQLRSLQQLRCDFAQGFLIGKPMPVPEFAAFTQMHQAAAFKQPPTA